MNTRKKTSLTATIEFYKLFEKKRCNNEKVVSKGNHLNWQKKNIDIDMLIKKQIIWTWNVQLCNPNRRETLATLK